MNWITKIIFFSQQILSVFLFDMNGACDEHDKECLNPNLDSLGEITHNKCGKSPALRRIWKSDLLSCVKECKVTSGCVSVSYRRPWNLCDLNTDVNKDNLADEKGCLFTLMSTWPKNLAGDCGTHACGEGQKCVVAGGQITCELAYCVGEPDVKNADIVEKFGLYKNLGNGVKYKCHPGFALRGPPLASCQTNGLWHTFFTCANVDDCASNPCQNGGICQDGVNEYSCTCRPGFSGDNCQTDIDECVSNPCLNDGTCIDGSNMYSCVCRAGYSGTNCEIDINECDSSPCQNLGTCYEGLNTYSCWCLPGYAGLNCSLSKDKTAHQSTTYTGIYTNKKYYSYYGVDGDISSIFHTTDEINPKWWVDLGQQHAIDMVMLRNRVDCCGLRLANVTVYVGHSTDIDQMEECAHFAGPGTDAQVITLHCESKPTGNIVLLSMMNGMQPLHLAEVEVYPPDVYTDN